MPVCCPSKSFSSHVCMALLLTHCKLVTHAGLHYDTDQWPVCLFSYRYYGYMYTHWLAQSVRVVVEQSQNCEDILMNFLVTHVSKLPPIKLSQHKSLAVETPPSAENRNYHELNKTPTSKWLRPDHFVDRQHCINHFVDAFGYMPLIRSSLRFDPLLYRDRVSRTRKKYRQMETDL